MHAVKHPDQAADDNAGENLMACHAGGLALAACARTDDEVIAAGTKRGDHVLDRARIVGAVAIHEHQDIRIAGSLSAGQARAPVTWAHSDDFGAGAARYLGRAVGRATVGNDDVVNKIARQCRNDRTDGLRFVESRNHDGHSFAHRRSGVQSRRCGQRSSPYCKPSFWHSRFLCRL